MQEWLVRSKNAWFLDVSDLPSMVQSLEAGERIAALAARPAVKFMEDKLGPYHPKVPVRLGDRDGLVTRISVVKSSAQQSRVKLRWPAGESPSSH